MRICSQTAVVALLLCGCAFHNAAPVLRRRAPVPFSASGDAEIRDRWWSSFENPALNRQVSRALRSSYTLAAAVDRLRAARALARREASDLWPDLDGVGSIDHTFAPGRDRSVYTWGLDAAWQVDLWGQIESRVDAERLRSSAAHTDYYAVALTLSAEVARTWFALVEAHAQLELLSEQIETNRIGLTSMTLRFERGFVRSADVFRQEQLLESTREQVVVVKARIETLEHQLAVLQGGLPQTAKYDPGSDLPSLPPLPKTGLPTELLKRRPDVRRDFLAFLAAERDLAAAISAQYPRLHLTGAVLNIANSANTLFRDWFVSIGSQLIGPLFDGGQRRAEVDRTAAVAQLRLNEYGQTMLAAFREVEDALALERYQRERIELLSTQVELLRRASEQLREQYLIGDADYLDVLSSITSEQRLQRETLTARLDLILIRISLYLALAGDIDPGAFDFEEWEQSVERPPEDVSDE